MRLHSISLTGFKGINKHGVGDPRIEIDFTKLPEGLIAIVGDNGLGKTTLMDNMHPFLTMPYRGGRDYIDFSYYDNCFGMAQKELVFEMNGVLYRSLLLIDVDRKKLEPYLYYKKGTDWIPIADGKSGLYATEIEKIMGSMHLFFTAIFRSQEGKSLSSHTKGEFKELFSQLLMLDDIGAKKETSTAVKKYLAGVLDKVTVELQELKDKVKDSEEKRQEKLSLVKTIEQANIEVKETKGTVADCQLKIVDLNVQKVKEESWTRERRELLNDIVGRDADIESFKSKRQEETARVDAILIDKRQGITRAEKILSGREKIQTAIREAKETKNTVADCQAKLADLNVQKVKEENWTRKRQDLLKDIAGREEETRTIASKRQKETDKFSATLLDKQQRITRAEKVLSGKEKIHAGIDREIELIAEKNLIAQNLRCLQTKCKELEDQGKQHNSLLLEISNLHAKVQAEESAHDHDISALQKEIDAHRKATGYLDAVPCKTNAEYVSTCPFAKDGYQMRAGLLDKESTLVDLKASPWTPPSHDSLVAKTKEADSSKDICTLYDKAMAEKAMLESKIENLDSQISEAHAFTELLPELKVAESVIEQTQAEIDDIVAQHEMLADETNHEISTISKAIAAKNREILTIPAIATASDDIPVMEKQLSDSNAKLLEIEALTRLLPELKVAESVIEQTQAEIKDIEIQHERSEDEIDREIWKIADVIAAKNAEIAAIPFIATANDDIAAMEKQLSDSNVKLDRLDEEISQLNLRLGAINDSIVAIIAAKQEYMDLKPNRDILKTELSEWKTIEKALGKDGIIALEIDDAGPSISTIANELLESCFGSRFAIKIVTTEPKADKKGMKEVFEIKVLDSSGGEPKNLQDLSGGERVWVESAICHAINIRNKELSGKDFLTCFEDECDGKLSKGNKKRFVAMKHKNIKLGNFHQTFFISQDSDIWGAADASIVLEKGNIAVNL